MDFELMSGSEAQKLWWLFANSTLRVNQQLAGSFETCCPITNVQSCVCRPAMA